MNAYLEAAAYRCEMAGALELIVTLDTFDFMRVKRRLRARYCSSLTLPLVLALPPQSHPYPSIEPSTLDPTSPEPSLPP